MKYMPALICCLLSFVSCQKDNEGRIPDVPVNFRAALTDPRLSRLNSAGGAVAFENYGVAGLILYNTGTQIVAFDRCSSVNPQQRCAVILDDPTLTATDPCSGAKYALTDGGPVKAPAVRPLKQYLVTIAGNILLVTN